MASTVAKLVKRMYNREEAADYLGISLSTFDRLRYAGKIEEVQISPHKIRFTEAELRKRLKPTRRRAWAKEKQPVAQLN